MIRIIVGTNRKKAVSSTIALLYQEILEEMGEESRILTLQDLPKDFLEAALYENSGKHQAFNDQFLTEIEQGQKFVFIVPEYNGSFPGVLKCFIDALSYPNSFKGKKCAIVGLSSGGQGGGLALSHLTDIFNYLGMHVLPIKPKLARIESFMSQGKLTNDLYNQLLRDQAKQIIAF